MKWLLLIFIGLLAMAHYASLFVAPPDAMMGDVYRILYIHVPSAWMAMLFFTASFVGSLGFLLRKKPFWDRLAVSAAEIGLIMTGLALALGSLWGRPVWGVWWTWDPRLTTTAVLFLLYAGYLMIRGLVADPDRRAKVAAAVGLLVYLNVPIVYLSVKWWRSLHQVQSSPSTMAPEMVMILRANALALLAVLLVLLFFRMRLERRRSEMES